MIHKWLNFLLFSPNYLAVSPFDEGDDKSTIEFNFCGEMHSRQQCPNSKARATLKNPDGTCVDLASDGTNNGHATRHERKDDG